MILKSRRYLQQSIPPLGGENALNEGNDCNIVNALETHMLLENERIRSISFHLCKFVNYNTRLKWTTNGCAQCYIRFHGNCFAFYHRRKEVESKRRNAHTVIKKFKILNQIFRKVKVAKGS